MAHDMGGGRGGLVLGVGGMDSLPSTRIFACIFDGANF